MKISIIVSTYNRPDALEMVLLSLKRQQIKPPLLTKDIEVLIADDGSTAVTHDLINNYRNSEQFPFQLIHVWHEDQGFRLAAIRNLAVSKAQGDYLIFIDGDCILTLDFIQNQYHLAEQRYLVAGNRVLLSQNYTQEILLSRNIEIATTSLFAGIMAKIKGQHNKLLSGLRLDFNAAWRKKHGDNWRRPKGCNLAIWREDYYNINGFDESFSGWGHEDADFVVRLLHAGVKIKDGRFAVPVYHLWHPMNDRGNEKNNMERLQARISNLSCIHAIEGVNKYA